MRQRIYYPFYGTIASHHLTKKTGDHIISVAAGLHAVELFASGYFVDPKLGFPTRRGFFGNASSDRFLISHWRPTCSAAESPLAAVSCNQALVDLQLACRFAHRHVASKSSPLLLLCRWRDNCRRKKISRRSSSPNEAGFVRGLAAYPLLGPAINDCLKVRPTGFEPVISGSVDRCLIQLGYGRSIFVFFVPLT